MSDMKELVPEQVKDAAKRAFLRTLYQGYGGLLGSLTLSAAAIVGFLDNPDWGLFAVTAAVVLLGPLISGARVYFSIMERGIPTEYGDAAGLPGRSQIEDHVEAFGREHMADDIREVLRERDEPDSD